MSHFLDRLMFFTQDQESFSGNHGVATNEDRSWEDGYRKRWQHDKIVRSTHGVNCTGSCSWKIYVKGGIVTWETQQTDYPRTRWDMPNHEPRGCARGASYSWYLYSANRVKYPLVRGRLLKSWREARLTQDPVAADPHGPVGGPAHPLDEPTVGPLERRPGQPVDRPHVGHLVSSYRLLNGLSISTRRTSAKPALAASRARTGSGSPSVPSPSPPSASEVVMQ